MVLAPFSTHTYQKRKVAFATAAAAQDLLGAEVTATRLDLDAIYYVEVDKTIVADKGTPITDTTKFEPYTGGGAGVGADAHRAFTQFVRQYGAVVSIDGGQFQQEAKLSFADQVYAQP